MAQSDESGDDLEDFVRRVAELRAARGLPPDEQQTLLDAALFELQHVSETLWPKYERLAAQGPARASADRTELQLLRALFQRLPLPVALIGGDTVVRRMNLAATDLTGVRAGYAAGRPLSGLLRPGDRSALRSQAAAVARGEGRAACAYICSSVRRRRCGPHSPHCARRTNRTPPCSWSSSPTWSTTGRTAAGPAPRPAAPGPDCAAPPPPTSRRSPRTRPRSTFWTA